VKKIIIEKGKITLNFMGREPEGGREGKTLKMTTKPLLKIGNLRIQDFRSRKLHYVGKASLVPAQIAYSPNNKTGAAWQSW
jgi:hypothetical protein